MYNMNAPIHSNKDPNILDLKQAVSKCSPSCVYSVQREHTTQVSSLELSYGGQDTPLLQTGST